MARKPMVTRTIASTKANILTVAKADKSIGEIEVILPRTYENEEQVLKTAKKLYPSDSVIYAGVTSYEVQTHHYVMPEEQFISLAVIDDNATDEDEE